MEVTSSRPCGFLFPNKGESRVVKTIEERLSEKGGVFLKDKEGRVVFRKIILSTISLKLDDCHNYILFRPQNPRRVSRKRHLAQICIPP